MPLSRNSERILGITLDGWAGVLMLALTVTIFLIFSDQPLMGDASNYSYRSARWMAEHGLSFIPSGEGRGEQAMGHPTLFYWLWAVAMRLLGDQLWVAHLLPCIATFLALLGCYKLGSHLGGDRLAGLLASLGLAASPVFLMQSFRPLPDSALVAAVAWSVYLYADGRFYAALLVAAVAVCMREQGLMLVPAYLVAETAHGGWRRPCRLLAVLAPALVIVLNGLAFLAVNGYFFFGRHMGAPSFPGLHLLLGRLRHFGGYLLAGDFRWILASTCLALLLAGKGRKLSPLSLLILLAPALLRPPQRLAYLAVCGLAIGWILLRRKALPSRGWLASILVPLFVLTFLVLISCFNADPRQQTLFRYSIAALPLVITGFVAAIRKVSDRSVLAVSGLLFVLATLYANGMPTSRTQAYSSLNGTRLPLLVERAGKWAAERGDSVICAPYWVGHLRNPALGCVQRPLPTRGYRPGGSPPQPGVSYAAFIETSHPVESGLLDSLLAVVPEGSKARLDSVFRSGQFRLQGILIRPGEPEGYSE
ncbi:hypothetical protein GF402_09275 [Candidatus Fermentibacteria bacterium]|nr:hypothetical protein [Candidatus Fermentibacteria bacterium]